MELTLKICNVDNCNLRISDLTQQTLEYAPEELDGLELQVYYDNNVFKYTDTYTINIIQYTSTKKTELLDTIYSAHDSELDEIYYQIPKDGFYTITHLVLPSIEWLENQLELQVIDSSRQVYVTDGNQIYQYVRGKLIAKEPEIFTTINIADTTISGVMQNTFSICRLYECYIHFCKKVLNSPLDKCFNKIDSDLIFKRDFLWMSINLIKYYTEFEQLEEAQRLLEKINRCGEFCNSIYDEHRIVDCGCSQTQNY